MSTARIGRRAGPNWHRRTLFGAALGLCLAGFGGGARAAGLDAASATGFVQSFASRLVAVVNGPGSDAAKRRTVLPLIDQFVDVNGIGRFCLGRFWRVATAAQQQQYLGLFQNVLNNSISSHLGEYRGVTFQMTQTRQINGDWYVGTTVNRPNSAPADVQWVVAETGGQPRVVDVVAEGTSLRVTQRSDYTSYLVRNNSSIAAFLAALQRQAAQGG